MGNPTPQAISEHLAAITRWSTDPTAKPTSPTVVGLLAAWLASPDGPPNDAHRCMAVEAGKRLDEWRPGVTLADFGAGELEAWQAWLASLPPKPPKKSKTRYAKSSVKLMVGFVTRAWRWGVRNERAGCRADRLRKLEDVPGPKIVRENRRILGAEWGAVEAALPHLHANLATLVRVHWHTGARPSELLELKVGEVKTSGVLRLPDGAKLDLTAAHLWGAVIHEHKTEGKGLARALLFGPVSQGLLAHRLPCPPESFLLPGERRPYVTVHRYVQAVRDACEAAGVPAFTPYSIRHSFSQRAQEAGFNLDEIGAAMGHKGRGMTAHYSKVDLMGASRVVLSVG